jgi:ubiquinone/menaquinone biosynthesis C-methylase UbiE
VKISLGQKTRKIYNSIHKQQSKLDVIEKKLKKVSDSFCSNLPKNFFKGKVCLDLGCGNMGFFGIEMLKKNAKKVYFVDYDNSINNQLKFKLKKFNPEKYEIVNKDIEKKIFKNNFFDFIFCIGVIHHLQKNTKILSHIYGYLKNKGVLAFDVLGEGGVMNKINKILRNEYENNLNSKWVINNIFKNKLKQLQNKIIYKLNLEEKKIFNMIIKYFDKDLILTFKDRILSPKYNEFNEIKLITKLKNIGFKKIKRIKIINNFNNIRKALSFFYENYKDPYSKFLYGNGNISIIAKKN